jgi:quercetin dioxygenase-like cupin family protein
MFGARPLPILLAFALGACATAAVESVAAPPEPAPTPAPAAAAPSGPPASVVKLDDAPVRRSPSGSATVAHLARGENAYLGRLELAAGAAVPEHQDATEEYIHVLTGRGTMVIDGTTHEIEAGTTVFMPANATVSFQNSDEPMTALQVFAGPQPASKYDAWQDPDATPVQRPKQ